MRTASTKFPAGFLSAMIVFCIVIKVISDQLAISFVGVMVTIGLGLIVVLVAGQLVKYVS